MKRHRFDEVSTISPVNSLCRDNRCGIRIEFDNASLETDEREKLCDRIMSYLKRTRVIKVCDDDKATATITAEYEPWDSWVGPKAR